MQRKRILTTWLILVLSLVFATPAFASGRPIALDSGHGGGDEGAVYGSFIERDMNWEITKACRDELEAMGYSVVIVNTSSQNYDLDERVQRAVSNNAPVLVSLHNNAWDRVSKERRGCTVLVPNSSSYEGGLYDIGQRFAAEVTSGLNSELGLPLWKDGSYERDYPADESGSTYPDGSRSDYYGIVRYARKQGIFGCIIEHGFLDNTEDAKIYRKGDTLKRMGIVDAHAIAAFYDEFCAYADQSQAARIASGWWVASGGRWWFRYPNGTYPAGRMAEIKGVTYGFDGSGWMVVGWGKFNGTWYWFDKNGALAHDTWTDDGYYVGSDGSWDTSVPKREAEDKDGSKDKPKTEAKWIKSGSRWWYQHADGSYPGVAPVGQYGDNGHQLGWADAGVIVPYVMWKQSGDTAIVDANWESMRRYMALVDEMKYESKQAREHQWADWLSYEKLESRSRAAYNVAADGTRTPKPDALVYWQYLGCCYWLWDARMMAEMARATGRGDEAAAYGEMADRALAFLRGRFVDKSDGMLIGLFRDMQTPALFALKLGVLESADAVAATKTALVKNIKDHGECLQTGFLGTSIIMDTLTYDVGAPEVAYTLLLQHNHPSWLYTVDQGATTFWERWNSYTKASGFGPSDMNSFNHYAYGAVVAWMYGAMAGIRAGEDGGFRHFTLSPVPDRRMGRVSAAYRSQYGTIKSSWAYGDDGKCVWTFTIPANTTATVRLPGGVAEELPSGTYVREMR